MFQFCFRFIIFLLLISSCILEASSVQQSFSCEPLPNAVPKNQFWYSLGGDYIDSSKINIPNFKYQKLQFSTLYTDFGAVFQKRFGMSCGYSLTNLNWRGNPYFGQSYFNTLCISLFGYEHWRCWDLRSCVAVNADLSHFLNGLYSSYDFLVWGRYRYRQNLGLHTGFLVFTGMHINRVYPIIGVDWQCSAKWKINLVYPVNIAAIYFLNEQWTVGFAGRYFFSRHRAGNHYRFPKSIFFYRAIGTEFTTSYQWECISLNFRIGYAFATKLRLARRNYSHQKNFNIDSAPYFGGEVKVYF